MSRQSPKSASIVPEECRGGIALRAHPFRCRLRQGAHSGLKALASTSAGLCLVDRKGADNRVS